MTTFSQLVDRVIGETRRPDLLTEVADYLNQTIRELHFTPDRGNVITYRDNLRELQLTANSEAGFTWQIPNPALFQMMQAVRYDSLHSRDVDFVYAPERVPSRALANHTIFYYRAGNTVVFSGYGGTNAIISLAYYEYPRRLKYRTMNDRQAIWDDETGWSYLPDWAESQELQLDARNLCSNWILLRWADVCAEGLRAKVYKRLSDDARARTAYSLYSQLRQGLFTSEVSVGGSLS
jgi:hypothetical protein